MRSASAVLLALALAAPALPAALAAEGHGGHGGEGPANPMVKPVTLFLASDGSLSPAPVEAGAVPAGPAMPDGTSEAVQWTVAATKNTRLDASVYVELFATALSPTLVAGGPEGAGFEVCLVHNGAPVEGACTTQRLESTLLQQGQQFRMKIFLPQADLNLAPGDAFGIQARFFGVNPEGQRAVQYDVGGEDGSRVQLRLRMAGLEELDLPAEVGPWPVAVLEGFDFEATKRANPGAKVFTLKAFQFGFLGGPVVVPNGTKVILHLTVDESLATTTEGHAGHGDAAGNASWDQNLITPLHGFSLASLDPRLHTVLFDGLVTTVTFDAAKPGNYTFLCTVFCGSGHGRMLDRLTIEGPAPETLQPNGAGDAQTLGGAKAPGFEGLAALAVAGLAALAARRRRA